MNNAFIHYLLIFVMLVNENTVVHCLLMSVHSASTNVNKHTCDFNNALLNAEININ